MDERKTVRLRRQILSRRQAASRRSSRQDRTAFRSISAARRTRRSRSPASMPTSTRCGARPTPRCANDRARARRAAPHGREARFSLSLRPILADTEDAAWAKADRILQQRLACEFSRRAPDQVRAGTRDSPPNEGSRRLLAAAAQGARLDKRLWTGVAALTGARRQLHLAWSERRIRWPRRCSTTTISASPPS